MTASRSGVTARGFTLIELLVTVALLGILARLSFSNFQIYRAKAANASVVSTLHAARLAAEAGQADPNQLPAMVGWAFQDTPGPMAGAGQYLPGFRIPKKTRVWAMYDPGCAQAWCITDFIEVQHCQADEFALWVRWGDGFEFSWLNLPFMPWGC